MNSHDIEDVFELSAIQEGMLFHSIQSPEDDVYAVEMAFTLTGETDVLALRRAWDAVIQRHPALRTSFVWETLDRPVQVVHRRVTLPWSEHDLRAWAPDERASRLQSIASAQRSRRFVLSEAPLQRVALVRMADDELRLIWTFHHLLLDGWSGHLVVEDLLKVYAAEVSRQGAELAPAAPYSEYVAWLREQDGAAAEAFWRRELEGFSEPTPIHIARTPDNAGPRARYTEVRFALPSEVHQKVVAMCRAHALTASTLAQGAWALVLSTYADRRDVLFGATVAVRHPELAGVESIVGPLINTIPVRVDVDPDARVADWLSSLQVRQLETRRFDAASLVDVQSWSDVRGTAMFDSILIFDRSEDVRVPEVAARHVGVQDVRVFERTNFPLTLGLSASPARFEGKILYDTERFDERAIDRLVRHLLGVIEGLASQPDAQVREIAVLGEDELHTLLASWNDTRVPSAELIHVQVEARASEMPDAIAVVAGDAQITYGELNTRANQLAWRLLRSGVRPDDRVGVHMVRSMDAIVAFLAVLKAGGAYVPLDPTYPVERLRFTCADARPGVVITHRAAPSVELGHDAVHLCVDEEAASLVQENTANPPQVVGGEHLIYVIYTSGSTGVPKGVENRHAGVANLVRWVVTECALGRGDQLTQMAAIGFDACALEIWPGLVVGATVHVLDEETRLSPKAIPQWLAARGITHAFFPPVIAEQLVGDAAAGGLTLRTLFTGSDKVLSAPRAKLPFRYINLYGPTETSVLATWGPIEASPTGEPPPIGRPLPGVTVYLLDASMRLVPIGVPGQLYIGGVAIGRGYSSRPALTAEKFVPDPFGGRPGARLYASGDLARYREDGSIEFLGRIDHQVKIRGLRIEIGEVESTLSTHPSVANAVVVVREDTPGDKRLVAYVVRAEDVPWGEAALRDHLKQTLPEYMVPAAFVTMASFPISKNGKIDRAALPAPDRSVEREGYVAPRTPQEEILAGLWSAVLGIPRVGIEDDFVALGGHSLLAMRLVSRVRDAFGVGVPLRALFEGITVAALAERLQGEARREDAPIVPVPRDRPLPLSIAQRRLWLLSELESSGASYSVPIALQLSGELAVAELRQAIDAVVARHEILRTTFTTAGDAPVQMVHPHTRWELPVVSVTGASKATTDIEVRRLISEEARRPFDLRRGPLLRTTLLEVSSHVHVLLVTMHHMVCDAWSAGALFAEIGEEYAAAREGRPSALGPLPIQYADFASWQVNTLHDEALGAQAAYWRERLDGVEPLNLPTDRPRPAVLSKRGSYHRFTLDPDLQGALRDLSNANGATLFMTLLTAFKVLLHRYSSQTDLCVGIPIANRYHGDVERLIGLFVNTLVVRSDLSDDPSFLDLLVRVREASLAAYAHQDLPFERIVEARGENDRSRSPVFQVMFDLQNAAAFELSLPGVHVKERGVGEMAANFDFTLTIEAGEHGFKGNFEYNTDLFDVATMERMATHFETLLRGIASDPEASVSSLPLISNQERHRLLVEWNAVPVQAASDATMGALLAERARIAPDAIAIVDDEGAINYRDLDARANQLARYLSAQGVRPGARVALCIGRSVALFVGMWGILKAGAAYVPLDPEYPTERLAFMLADSESAVLVTDETNRSRFLAASCPVVSLDGDAVAITATSSAAPDVAIEATDVAYVIYTSGSTGNPKGVMVTQGPVVNYGSYLASTLALTPDDRVTQFASLSFDVSGEEIYPTACAGARLVLLNYEARHSVATFLALVVREGVTIINLPTAFWHVWVDELTAHPFPDTVRAVVIGGEAASRDHVARWMDIVGRRVRLINTYGPTEATIACLTAELTPELSAGVPIGKPVRNTESLVLDPRGQLVPVGVAGELFIGGGGVSLGYFRRPALTAENFVPHPTRHGERLYRTGDLVRWGSDGNVEFLGRVDEQVKIRGHRMELGEIEAALTAYEPIRQAVVVVREDTPGDKRLIAYLTTHTAAFSRSDARAFLKERLPTAMIPSAFVVMPALPLTKNQKIDRAALPAPDDASGDEVSYVTPRSPVEEAVSEIFAKVLDVERVGVNDNFFELGGHSLLAAKAITRLRAKLGIELPVRRLFDSPTPAEMASFIEGMERGQL